MNYFSLQTIEDYELWWFDICDSFSLVQPIVLEIRLVYYSVLYESVGYAAATIVCFGNKACFQNLK